MTRVVVAARRLLAALLLLFSALFPAVAGSRDVRVAYDSDFGGYVPIVGGIERPDLVADEETGRVPAESRESARTARRALRRLDARAGWIPMRRLAPTLDEASREPSRRWVRRNAVVSKLVVLDDAEQPVAGARVFRYYDPLFYTVNEGADGARRFEARRYLPAPFPAFRALEMVDQLESYWRTGGWADVSPAPVDFDAWNNPWRRADPRPWRPPVEFLGETSDSGALRSVSGLFNLEDPDRFPAAIVPSVLKIGFVVVADGFHPAFTEVRLAEGGTTEERIVRLLRRDDHPVLGSNSMRVALSMAERQPLDPQASPAEIERLLRRVDDLLLPLLMRVPEMRREAAAREVRARIVDRLLVRARHAPLRILLARMAWQQTPEHPGRCLRLAVELDATGGPPAEIRDLLETTLRAAPGIQAAHRLYDRVLVSQGADAGSRRLNAARLLQVDPFDPWGRARLASLELQARRPIRAFDHLRYSYMLSPGLGGDEELARELNDYYWRLGLPEKGGTFIWLLTGRPPEDPFIRLRGAGR